MTFKHLKRGDPSNAFLNELNRFVGFAAQAGIAIQPCQAGGPIHFNALAPDRQMQVLESFRRYVQEAESTVKSGMSLNKSRQFLWRMLQGYGLRPASDVFDRIVDDDVVEIYSLQMTQMFRSLRFFEVCSYSIDEVLCRPFWELYRRDEVQTANVMATVAKITGSTDSVTIDYDTGEHEQVEIGGRQLRWMIRNIIVSPLFDAQDKLAAVVNVVRPIRQL